MPTDSVRCLTAGNWAWQGIPELHRKMWGDYSHIMTASPDLRRCTIPPHGKEYL
ncbi:hypothetical protein [uncultured Ruminococcus sp.]|uniref:hypothetical protein n=1 Tax=uncultured Ruminococcus sp. TaxID=165186 RepID=UPI00266B45F4|nr:hypothetical protein [uncultured Ruminococcus sp.]